MSQDGGKTERATPRKRSDERKKGNIFQSRDVVTAFSLLGMMYLMRMGGGLLIERLAEMMRESLGAIGGVQQLGLRDAAGMIKGFIIQAGMLILPIGGVAMLLGVMLTGAQTRFLVTPSLLTPKFSRISPLSGLKSLFSKKTLVELLKGLVKVVIIGSILFADIRDALPSVVLSPLVDPFRSLGWVAGAILDVSVRIAMFMAMFAAFDYFYQWWDYEKRMMMSKQEIKEEYKRMEGDPNVKGRIRSIQRRMAMMRMMSKVKTADVVIRNPTHYAVALKYDPPKYASPVVVAKGADLVALRIVKLAEEHGVYVTENRALARGLFEAVELDRQIPEAFYKPVADIIAFIYNLKKRRHA